MTHIRNSLIGQMDITCIGRGVMEEATIFHTTAVHAQPTNKAMKKMRRCLVGEKTG